MDSATRGGPRGAAATDLIQWLTGVRRKRRVDEIADWFGASSRCLTDGWWRAGDLDTAWEFVEEALSRVGVPPPEPSAFRARHELVRRWVKDEEQQRRHQLGFLAVYANARLAVQRFYCLGYQAAWEATEPPWVLLDPAEYRLLLPLVGPPGELEAPYSGATSLPAEVRPVLDLDLMTANEAHRCADDAFRAGRYAEVLYYLPKAVLDGDHGLLAQLLYIDTLRLLGRLDEARALWSAVADEWLSGVRPVWDTQWKRLLELYAALEPGGDDPRLGLIEEKAGKRA